MNIDITARNFTISENLRDFVKAKSSKLLTYDKNIDTIKVIFLKESRAEKVEIHIVNDELASRKS